jgi:hypothetical protein
VCLALVVFLSPANSYSDRPASGGGSKRTTLSVDMG